jgi:hypothetical protein
MVSVSDVLKAVSDDKSLVLFNTIGLATEDSGNLMKILKLTRKQYYSRINMMVDSGIIRRIRGKYFLTSFGKIIYEAQKLICKATIHTSKLKAVDLLDTPEFSAAEYSKIVDTLIQDDEIKQILSRQRCINSIRSEEESNHKEKISVPVLTR